MHLVEAYIPTDEKAVLFAPQIKNMNQQIYWTKQIRLKILSLVKLQNRGSQIFLCLGWANESWEKKLWNKYCSGNTLLLPQTYGGIQDYAQHFYAVLPILKDKRYIKVDDHPFFLIYRPYKFDDLRNFISTWQELAQKEGLGDIHFMAHARGMADYIQFYFDNGCVDVYTNRLRNGILQRDLLSRIKRKLCWIFGIPELASFNKIKEACDRRG